MAPGAAEKRGPKVGDAVSLWNFTASPGWNKEEAAILKAALCVYGIGKWQVLVDARVLPGKVIQQMNGQTQRLLGQQSIAAFNGLQVDIDRVRADNLAKIDVERKSGLVINSGPNPTKEIREQQRKDIVAAYGLSEEDKKEWKDVLDTLVAEYQANNNIEAAGAAVPLIESDASKMSKADKIALLHRLRSYMKLVLQAQAECRSKRNAGGVEGGVDVDDEQENVGRAANTSSPVSAAPKRKRAQGGRRGRAPRRRQAESSDEEGDFEEAEAAGAARPSRGGRRASAGMGMGVAVFPEGMVSQLTDMGFDRKRALVALEETGGEAEAAITWLFDNCA